MDAVLGDALFGEPIAEWILKRFARAFCMGSSFETRQIQFLLFPLPVMALLPHGRQFLRGDGLVSCECLGPKLVSRRVLGRGSGF